MVNKYIRNSGNGNFKILIPFEINTYSTWLIKYKITTANSINDSVLITTEETSGVEKKNFTLKLNDNHLILQLSYDGNTYTEVSQSSLLLDINSVYYIKLGFDGTDYTVSVSTDDLSYTNYIVINSTEILYSDSAYIIFIPTKDSTYFNGGLDIDSIEVEADSNTLFDGSSSENSGYYNKNVNIVDGVASNFSTSKYIQCNGFELTDYVKGIIHLNITDSLTKQTILFNGDNSEIYIMNNKIFLNISNQSIESPISTGNYYIGYLCKKNNITKNFEHSLYYIVDDGYYNDYTELPDFEIIYGINPWTAINTITYQTNVFKNGIYIGSNKTNYFLGTIDLNNTILSNNVVTYSIAKPSLFTKESPDTRCYVPVSGTRLLNTSTTSIDGVTLDQMIKLSVSAEDYYDHLPISQSNFDITYTSTNSDFKSDYYKETSAKNIIYTLPGSDVTYEIKNLPGYTTNFTHTTKTESDITTDTDSTIILKPIVTYDVTISTSNTYEHNTEFKFYVENTLKVTTTNILTVSGISPGRNCTVIINSPGYKTYTKNFIVNSNINNSVTLEPSTLVFIAEQDNSTISYENSSAYSPNIEYSFDKTTWTMWQARNTKSLNKHDVLYVRGNNQNGFSKVEDYEIKYTYFTITGKIGAYGNINSLLDGDDGSSITTIPNDFCFYSLFNGDNSETPLTHAPELPALNLSKNCYANMFDNCTSLTYAPELPALNLSKNCYLEMFKGCTSLTHAPELPALNLADSCYANMFYNCTSLTYAPELPALNLADSCYTQMFYNCIALTHAPELQATILYDNCYSFMFYNCTQLSNIKLKYTGNFNSNYFWYWVAGVSPTGTLYYKGTDTTVGVSAIPTGWTVDNT